MAVVLLVAFVLVVALLTHVSRRNGTAGPGCCAPADPGRDLRMRD